MSETIEVYRVAFTKQQLASLPAAGRALLILAGHVLNQLAMLMRFAAFSTNATPPQDFENSVAAGQSHSILRLLYGTIFEIWRMIQGRQENQKLVGQTYWPKLSPCTLISGLSDQAPRHWRATRHRVSSAGLLCAASLELSDATFSAGPVLTAFCALPAVLVATLSDLR